MGTMIIKRKILESEHGNKCKKCECEATHMLDVTDTVGNILSLPYCSECIKTVMNTNQRSQ